MEQVVRWSKKLFSNTTVFLSGNMPIGFLSIGAFSYTHTASLNHESYAIVKEGLFSSTYKVYDKNTKQLLATVIPNLLNRSAAIYLPTGERWDWSLGDWLGAKWIVTANNGLIVRGENGFLSIGDGSATSNSTYGLPIILGLFLSSIRNSASVALLVVFIVLFLVILR